MQVASKWIFAISITILTSGIGCGEDPLTADETAQESIVCGITCPPGEIPSYFTCSTACAGTCPNALACVPAPPPSATISGSPSTVTVPAGSAGTSRICWTTQYLRAPVWIRVRVNGAPGQLFTKESDNGSACENANWIVGGNQYSFRIHTSNSDSAPYLASTTVQGVVGGSPPPPPPPPGCSNCQSGYDCHCGDICRPSNSICP